MKIIKIILLIVFFMMIIFSTSCVNSPKYTAEEWKQIQENTSNQDVATTSINNNEINNSDSKEISKIEDYDRRLKEWDTYYTDAASEVAKNSKTIIDLKEKLIQAGEENNWDKYATYYGFLADEHRILLNNLSKIYVPKTAVDSYEFLLEGETRLLQYCNYVSIYINTKNFDPTKADSLFYESDNAFVKEQKEIERIEKQFNQEAKELGLEIPYISFKYLD